MKHLQWDKNAKDICNPSYKKVINYLIKRLTRWHTRHIERLNRMQEPDPKLTSGMCLVII